MEKPFVGIGRTPASHAIEAFDDIAGPLRTAIAALRANGPNARDYDDRINAAQHEHAARVQKLESVLEELASIRELY